jgi:thiamine biosynthesis lipoprotein
MAGFCVEGGFMGWTKYLLGLAALALLLMGCEPKAQVQQFGGPTMGSTYSVKYLEGPGVAPKAQLQAATQHILDDIDQQLSTYRADSDIERFNALPANSCLVVGEMVRALVQAGEQLSQESGGALDLTVEPLLNLWGFGPQSRGEQVPSAEQIAEARLRVGHQHLRLDGEQLCKDAAVEVDFNSIAAGYAVDRVSARLQALGVGSSLVEITGELKAQGKKADGSSWRIAIEAPRDDVQQAQQILDLDDLAVSTSGDYRNYFERDGQRYSHTLDPRSGAPITHHLAAVTVIDPSALRADGLSTLLMVLGPERGLAYAEQHRIAALFVVREPQGFVARGSTAFTERFGAGDTP